MVALLLLKDSASLQPVDFNASINTTVDRKSLKCFSTICLLELNCISRILNYYTGLLHSQRLSTDARARLSWSWRVTCRQLGCLIFYIAAASPAASAAHHRRQLSTVLALRLLANNLFNDPRKSGIYC